MLDDTFESARSNAIQAFERIAIREKVELITPAISKFTKLPDDSYNYARSNAALTQGWIGRVKLQLVEPLILKLI